MGTNNRQIIRATAVLSLFLATVAGGLTLTGQSTWDYPVKPGTEKWGAFKTSAEAVAACRIPDEVVASMPTADLFGACLDYPLLSDVFMQENIADGIPVITSYFNGLAALFERKDCAQTILETYKNEHLPKTKSVNPTVYFRMFYMELAISTSGILEQLDGDAINGLMLVTLDKIKEKREMDYDIFCQSSSALVLSRALCLAGHGEEINGNPVLNAFNGTGRIFDLDLVDQIVDLTNKYLDSHEQD